MARLLIALAGLMGAAGVALAAASAHGADASRLASASAMLLFHATAILGCVALLARGLLHGGIGLIAAIGFVIGAALFAGDLTCAAICRPFAVSVRRADRRNADDRELAGGDAGGGGAAAIRSPDGAQRIRGRRVRPDRATLIRATAYSPLCASPANQIERWPR